MYDEFVKRLREKAGAFDYDGRPDIACDYEQAANAIEELTAIREEQKAQIILMAAEIEEQQPRWIPVTERLPNNGKKVLVFEFGRVEQAYTTTYTADGSLCWVVINGGSYHRISDADCPIKWWMPLPQPPKEE